ncbi:MAG: adenylate/guanylate cyclase domain-containing protein [bacterium]
MKKEKVIIPLIGVFIGIVVSISFSVGLFRGLENFFEDILFSPKKVSPEIVIVAIDSESIAKIGQWPWQRSVFAEAISNLEKSKPKVLGVDVVFSDPSRYGTADDQKFSNALQNATYPIVLSAEASPLIINKKTVEAGNWILPLQIFTDYKNVSVGHVNLVLDADGVSRSLPLFIPSKGSSVGDTMPALAYEIFNISGASALQNKIDVSESITRIFYSVPTGYIHRIPFYRVLDGSAVNLLKNKIVLLGATSPDLHDEQLTPLSRGTKMTGIEIQANILNMFLENYRLAPISTFLQILWILLSALIPALIFLILSSRRVIQPIVVNIVVGMLYVVAVIILFDNGVVVNLLHITFGWVLSTGSIFSYRYFATERDRVNLKNIFSKYVSKDVMNEILKDPTKVKLGGEEKEVTVFFSDIRGFTNLSEGMAPAKLIMILNRYFTAMTNQVLVQGGVVDKYIGDAIMAFWGAPIDDPEQAEHALNASLAMLIELKKLNEELVASGESAINIGIGLYTGPAVVGNVGSDTRFDYTVIGDTVNVASRLEGLNKEYKTNIIVGETTKNKLGDTYPLTYLGSVAVKGRKEPLNIYTISLEK